MGCVQSTQKKLGTPSLPYEQPRPVPSAFERMAQDAFSILAKYLYVEDAKKLESTSKEIQAKILHVREKVTHAHLSDPLTTDGKLAVKLAKLAKHFPALNSLELNISSLTVAGLRILAEAPQLPRIVRITLYGNAEEMMHKKNEELSMLVQRIDFTRLEAFDLGRAGFLPKPPIGLLVEKLPSCEALKAFCLHNALDSFSLDAQEILIALPGTLEELGPFMKGECSDGSQLPISDAFADRFMEKCKNPERIKKCDLVVSRKYKLTDLGISRGKLGQFLSFLPLSKMTHVRFAGACMNRQNLVILASQLQQNFDLIELSIIGAEVGLSNALNLLQSLHSPNLEKLTVQVSNLELSEETISPVLLQRLASLPKLCSFTLGRKSIDLAAFRAQPQIAAS